MAKQTQSRRRADVKTAVAVSDNYSYGHVLLGHGRDPALDNHDALKYLEAISGEIDQIKPRDRSRFALLMHDEAKRQPDRSEFILSLIPPEASWAEGE